MPGPYAGFELEEVLLLVPDAGSLTPEALYRRLEVIRSRHTPAEISALLMAGMSPTTTQERTGTHRTRKAKAGSE